MRQASERVAPEPGSRGPVISHAVTRECRQARHTDSRRCRQFQKFCRAMMETANMSLHVPDKECCVRDGGNIAREAVRTEEIKQCWVPWLRLLCPGKIYYPRLKRISCNRHRLVLTFKCWLFFLPHTGVDFNQIYLGYKVKQTNEKRQHVLSLILLSRYSSYYFINVGINSRLSY